MNDFILDNLLAIVGIIIGGALLISVVLWIRDRLNSRRG